MAAIPAAFNHRGNKLSHKFTCKTGDTFALYQAVVFDSGSSTNVTATTAADSEAVIGIAMEAITTAAAGREIEILLLAPGDIFVMINGGTCTAGLSVAIEGTDGRVTNVGATPASGSCIGIALATTSTDGDYVPVLVGRH